MIWYDMIWYDMIWYDMIWYDMIWYDMICLTATGLTPGGSSTVHINKQYTEQHNRHKRYIEQHNSLIRKSADRALSLRNIPWYLPCNWGKKHGKTVVRVAGECQLAKNIQNRAYLSIRIHKHNNNARKTYRCGAYALTIIAVAMQRWFLCIVEAHVTVSSTKDTEGCTTMFNL